MIEVPERGLTLHRPWLGGAILAEFDGRKEIENRPVRPSKAIANRTLALHAGKVWRKDAAIWIAKHRGFDVGEGTTLECHASWGYEGIVGVCRVTGWIERGSGEWVQHRFVGKTGDTVRFTTVDFPLEGQKRWWIGKYAWTLEAIRPLIHPVECRGMQGLWPIPDYVRAQLETQIQEAA